MSCLKAAYEHIGVAVALAALAAFPMSQGCLTKRIEPQRAQSDQAMMKALNEIEAADPGRDLQDAIARSDTRFVGIMAYALDVPGLNEQDNRVQTQGVRIIEGTTDAPDSTAAAIFQIRARSYAERYNHLLLEYLQHRDSQRTNNTAAPE